MDDLKLFGRVGLDINQLKEDIKTAGDLINSLNVTLKTLENQLGVTSKGISDEFGKNLIAKYKSTIPSLEKTVEEMNNMLVKAQRNGYNRQIQEFDKYSKVIRAKKKVFDEQTKIQTPFNNVLNKQTTTVYNTGDIRIVQQLTDSLGRQIQVVKQLDKERNVLLVTETKYIENYAKQRAEIEKLQQEARKLQHNEWQSRFKESLAPIGKQSEEIKKLNAYYKELETTSRKERLEREKIVQATEKQIQNEWKSRRKEAVADLTKEWSLRKDMTKFYQQQAKEAEKKAKIEEKANKETLNYYKKITAEELKTLQGSAFSRRAGHLFDYVMISGAMFTVQRAMKEVINVTKEFEVGQVNLQRILRATADEMENIKQITFDVSKATGTAVKDIQDIENLWIRTGRENIEELRELTEITAVGMNTARFEDAEESVSFLNAAINQMANGDWKQAQAILDSWVKTADKTAVKTTKDLAEVMARAGSQAKQLGLDFHDLNAVTAILASRMAMSGDRIGTALKTIFARFQNETNIKALRELGIEIQEVGETGELTFREFSDIMDDLNQRSKELRANDALAELAKIEEILGGTRMRPIISNLIEGWDDYAEIVQISRDSAGFAMEQNEKIMETFDKQVEVLKANLSELAVTIGEAGLLDFLSLLASGTSNVIDEFNSMDANLKNLISTLSVLMTAFGLLNVTSKRIFSISIINWVQQFIQARTGVTHLAEAYKYLDAMVKAGQLSNTEMVDVLKYLNGSEKVVLTTTRARTAAIQANTLVTRQATAATVGLMTALKATIAIVAVVGVLLYNYNKSLKENTIRQLENVKATKERITETTNLIDKLEQLREIEDLSAENQQELKDVQNQIAELYPELIVAYDSEGNAIIANSEKLKEYVALKREEYLQELKMIKLKGEDRKAQLEQEKRDLEKQIQELTDKISSGQGTQTLNMMGTEYEVDITQALIDKRAKLVEKQKELNEELVMYANVQKEILGLELDEHAKTLKNMMDKNIDYSNFVRNLQNMGYTQDQITIIFQKAKGTYQETGNQLQEFEDDLEGVDNELEDTIKTLEDYTKAFTDQYDATVELKNMLEELNSEEGLSAESKEKIMTSIHQLIPLLENESDLRAGLTALIKEQEEQTRTAYNEMLMHSEAYYNAIVQKNEWLRNALASLGNDQVSNAKTIADAKLAIEENLIKTLSGAWARYYNAMALGNERVANEMELQAEKAYKSGRNTELVQAVSEVSKLYTIVDKLNELSNVDLKISATKIPKSTSSSGSSKASNDTKDTKFDYNSLLDLDSYEKLQRALQAIEHELGILERTENFLTTSNADKSKVLAIYNAQLDMYRSKLSKSIELDKEYINLINDIDSQISKLNKNTEDYEERLKFLTDAKQKYEEEMKSNILSMIDYRTEIEKINAQMEKMVKLHREDAINALKELRQKEIEEYNQRLESISTVQSKIIEIIRKREKFERKAIQDIYDAEMKALDESHNRKVESYQQELDEFRNMIQGKIDALNEQWEEEDYNEKLRKEQAEATRLQQEINKYSLDTSLEGRNKVIELRKQLAEQNEKIAKMQSDKEREILLGNLKQQIEDKEQEVDNKTKLEDEYYDGEKQRLDNWLEYQNKIFDEMYSEHNIMIEARKALDSGYVKDFEGNMVKLEDAYVKFENRFGEGMGILGDKIKNDFIASINQAILAVQQLDHMNFGNYTDDYSNYTDTQWDEKLKETGYTPLSTSTRPAEFMYWSESDYQKYVQNKKDWEKATSQQKAQLSAMNTQLRAKYWGTEKANEDNYSWQELVAKYKDGGVIPRTGFILAHEQELYMNQQHQNKLWNFISQLPERYFNGVTGKVSTPSLESTGNIIFKFDNLINVEGNVTEDILPELERVTSDSMEIIKGLNKIGVFRRVK